MSGSFAWISQNMFECQTSISFFPDLWYNSFTGNPPTYEEMALKIEELQLQKCFFWKQRGFPGQREIKTLRGIVPICSHCKKIRDDKGYWNHLEAYIQKHSDASFSHGICPECAGKLYPGFDPYDNHEKS